MLFQLSQKPEMFVVVFCYLMVISTQSAAAPKPYKIDVMAASLYDANPKYVGPGAYARVSRKTRRGPPTMDVFYPLLQDLTKDFTISYTSYQKNSNKWILGFLKGQMSICESIESKIAIYRFYWDFSNFPRECPIVKGNYTVNNFRVDAEVLPLIPTVSHEWKFVMQWAEKGIPILIQTMESKVTHKGVRQRKERSASTNKTEC